MKIKTSLITALVLVLAVPSVAGGKNKKKQPGRGMLENMQAVPCGVKEKGVTGVGSVFASAGIEHVNSDEKLCPQYLLRTDEMEYNIRPVDTKHAVLLPVGHEGEFKIKKNRLYLKVPDGDRKMRAYQVVSIKPLNREGAVESSAYRTPAKTSEYRRPQKPAEVTGEVSNPPQR
jgi:hypothetical protein